MVKLRPIIPSDRERMLDIFMDDSVKQTYLLPDFADREEATSLFLRMMELSGDPHNYIRAIVVKDHLAGFLNNTEITNDTIELGYVIHPDSQNMGYMTQALKLAVSELFALGYRQVTAGAFEENLPSVRVMQKAGMHLLPKTDLIPYRGTSHRCVFYSIEKQE